MQEDGLGLLTRQLRADPPGAVAALADEHLRHFASALHAARVHQAEQLQAASDQALEHIPRLLRGPVKKIIG